MVCGWVLAAVAGGCTVDEVTLSRCDPGQRLAIVAQSVPGADYVPCLEELPPGWQAASFEVDDDGARLELRSDRATRPLELTFSGDCRRGGSTPIEPRAVGVRSYLRVDSISPRYAGRFFDVFAGGCVVTSFDLERGPHIAVLDALRQATNLYPRRQLRQELADELGIELDP